MYTQKLKQGNQYQICIWRMVLSPRQIKKAQVLNKFFASVFIQEDLTNMTNIGSKDGILYRSWTHSLSEHGTKSKIGFQSLRRSWLAQLMSVCLSVCFLKLHLTFSMLETIAVAKSYKTAFSSDTEQFSRRRWYISQVKALFYLIRKITVLVTHSKVWKTELSRIIRTSSSAYGYCAAARSRDSVVGAESREQIISR